MLSLAQKLKFQKTCRNRFYNHIRVVLCKTLLQKPPNIQLACWLKVIGNTNSAEQRVVLTELGFVFFLNVSEAYVVNRGLQGRTKNNDKYLATLKRLWPREMLKNGLFRGAKGLITIGKIINHVDHGPTCN